MYRQYFNSIFCGLIAFITMNCLYSESIEGIAISAVTSEMVVCLLMSIYSYKFFKK
jgi:hypothetical protein